MNFHMPPEYYASYLEARRLAEAPEQPPLQHTFEDKTKMQQCGVPQPGIPAPATYQAQGDYSQQYQQPHGAVLQQTQSNNQSVVPQESCKAYRSLAPPRTPTPQQFLQVGPPPQSDAVVCWEVQLAKSHEKSTFLDHPTIPRYLHSYVEQDMACLPPSLPYVRPISRASVRPTVQVFPGTSQLAAKIQLPLGVILQPFAEPQLAEVDFAQLGGRIVRCVKCATYINPFTTFTDAGRRWQCIMCRHLNEVSPEYFCRVDPQTGLREDLLQRPELTHCSVDIYPSREFLRRPPQRPAFLLMLDCSYQAVASGHLQAICSGVLAALETMKDEDAIYMGLVGFSSTVYFFNLSTSLQSPRIVVAPDVASDDCKVEDNFKLEPIELPCSVNELLVNVKDSYPLLKELFENLPNVLGHTKDVGSAFGPALTASISILENSGGKIIASIDTMPSIGCGKLKQRFNVAKLSNQPKEYTMLSPANDWYKQLALVCSNGNISVDLFAGSSHDLELATVAPLARYTSGKIYRCTPITVNGIARQVHRVLTRYTAFESILRVRTSKGVVVPNFYGHCHVREPDLLALPVGDEDSSYTAELQLTPEFKGNFVYVQIAIVYTTRARERRIRVHTFQLSVSQTLGAVVNSADALAVTALLSKMAVDSAFNVSFQQAQRQVTERMLTILQEVKKHNESQGQRGGYFSLPHSLRFVPQLLHGFFRSAAIGLSTSSVIHPDERVAAMSMVMCTAPQGTLPFYTGWCFEVYSPMTPPEELPQPIFSTQSFFKSDGVFLVHTGGALVLWYGRNTDVSVLNVFGLAPCEDAPKAPQQERQSQETEQRYQISEQQLLELRQRFDVLAWYLSDGSHCAFSAALEVCPQGNKVLEPALTRIMMEDEVRSLPSYTSFLRDVWQKTSLKK
uniref:Protein transport protein Sec24A n=1 Tax=Trypanosoma congolense (strain IL3000) TaxID=1068625 RepID=G0UKJ7_TRYCI|nr:putative protein transport protein Sec24A [Trypanosoma congolense IL3000]